MNSTVVVGRGGVLAVVVVVVVVKSSWWWWGWYKKQQWEQVGRVTVIDDRDDGHFLSHSRSLLEQWCRKLTADALP